MNGRCYGLGAFAGEPEYGVDIPTTVTSANGQTWTIPSGPAGSAPWARQAALISDAYKQLGNAELAAVWWAEWGRRWTIYNRIQAGEDRSMVLRQFMADLLLAPARIAADLGNLILHAGDKVLKPVFETLGLIPWLIGGGVALALIIALKGQAPAVLKAVRG